MAERDQLGLRTLQLLAEDWMVSVLTGLADGPIRPAELERGLPHAGHSVVIRRLRGLLDGELVSCEHQSGVPPHPGSTAVPRRAYYSLTDAGRTLGEVTAEADRWEQTWCPELERGAPPGILALGLSANQRTRKIMLALADGPLAVGDVQSRLPDLRSSTLRRRLSNLVLGGLLERQELGRVQRYGLTARARDLAMVAMLAGRWEWQRFRPEHPVPGSDLIDLLHMLAPIAHVPRPTAGICQLHLQAHGAAAPDIYLAAQAGSIRALPEAPATPPEAVGHATPEAWCDALLLPHGRITVSGNRTLMRAVIGALSAALLPKPPYASSPANR
jgi:DNA-binding HxlR family transcriptional regulator